MSNQIILSIGLYNTTGKPLDNCAVYLLDASKVLIKDGEIGEIYVAGSHLCSGYVRNREMERFLKNHIDNTPGERLFDLHSNRQNTFYKAFGLKYLFA